MLSRESELSFQWLVKNKLAVNFWAAGTKKSWPIEWKHCRGHCCSEALQGSGQCKVQSAKWALAKAHLAPDLKPAQELATAARNILDQLSLQPPNMAASSNRNSGLEASTRSHLLPNELTTARNSPETNFLHNLPNMGMLLNHACVQTFGPIPGFMLPWDDFWICLQLESMTAACRPFDQICLDIYYRASTTGDCAAKYGPDLYELRD